MGEVIGYCETCSKQFRKYRSFQKYCSNQCRRIATEKNSYGYERKRDVKKNCAHCNTEFETNNLKKIYCSNECYKEHQIIIRKVQEKDLRICPVCDTEFKSAHVSKKYCSNFCYITAKKQREKKT